MHTLPPSLRRSRSRSRKRTRGMAVVATMLVLMALLSLALLGEIVSGHRSGGTLSVSGNGLTSAARLSQTTQALTLAESGVEVTMQWLHTLSGPPALNSAFPLPKFNSHNPGDAGATYALNGGTFTVMIYPDDANYVSGASLGSVTTTPKRYYIQSTGSYGGVTQIVRAYITQTSFGKYAFFTDHDPSNIYWVGGLNSFDGPTHFNGSNGNPTNVVWADGKPIFNFNGADAFTYSGSVAWYHNSSGNAQPPISASDYLSVAQIGASGVNKTDKIDLPKNSLKQQYAAWGASYADDGTNTPPPPPGAPTAATPSGVTVTPGGGIYIHCKNSADKNDVPADNTKPVNDVQQMVLSVDAQGNQVITIDQNNDSGVLTRTKITIDKRAAPGVTHTAIGPANGTLVSQPDVTGATNGVVYCDGNIGATQDPATSIDGAGRPYAPQGTNMNVPGKGLSGTIADGQALTISTDATSKNINLNGSVTYQTPRAKDGSGKFLPETDPANANFVSKAGTLGIVASAVQLVNNNALGQPLGDTELDATVLAQDTLQTIDYSAYYMDTNSANSLGSYSSGGRTYYYHWVRQPHKFLCMGGEIAAARGTLGTFNSSTLQMQTGFSGNYSYDARLANSPPPFFPTTSSQYDILSWQRVGSSL